MVAAVVVAVENREEDSDFLNPLRGGWGGEANASICNEHTIDNVNDDSSATVNLSSESIAQIPSNEWTSFRRFLMQKFSISIMIFISYMSNFYHSLFNLFVLKLFLWTCVIVELTLNSWYWDFFF